MCQYSAEDGTRERLAPRASRQPRRGRGRARDRRDDRRLAGGPDHAGAARASTDERAGRRVAPDHRLRARPLAGEGRASSSAHAGRKASCALPWEGDAAAARGAAAWPTLGPSAVPFGPRWPAPKAMDRADIDRRRVRRLRARRPQRARRARLRPASSCTWRTATCSRRFLSPLSNRRSDELRRVAREPACASRSRCSTRCARPGRPTRPVFVRISATDWMPDGTRHHRRGRGRWSRELSRRTACDVVDVSSGGQLARLASPVYGRMYQVPLRRPDPPRGGHPGDGGRRHPGVDHANTVLAAGPRRPLRDRAPAPRRSVPDAA